MCSVEVREGFPIKDSCVHRVDLHSVLANLVLGHRNKDCKKLTEHKFNSLVEDLLPVNLSCHTLFPFSSNYSAVCQSLQSSLGEKPLCTAVGESVCGISVAQNTFSRKCKPCRCVQSSQLHSVSETDVPQREDFF